MPEPVIHSFPSREECVVADLLAARAAATPDKLFLLFDDERWTYGDAAREAWRAAHALHRCGVAFGDYVSVWIPTGPDVVRGWFGANAAGAVYAPLNLAAKGSYLEHTLNLAESKVLLAHHELVERLDGIDAPHLETVVVVGGPAPRTLPWKTVTLDELLDGVPDERPVLPRRVEPWDDLSLKESGENTVSCEAFHFSFRPQQHAVPQNGKAQVLNVIRNHIITASQRRYGLAAVQQSNAGTG